MNNGNNRIIQSEKWSAGNYHPLPIVLERGEGGVIIPPAGYLREVRRNTAENDVRKSWTGRSRGSALSFARKFEGVPALAYKYC